jgi:nitrate reductase delta subunit
MSTTEDLALAWLLSFPDPELLADEKPVEQAVDGAPRAVREPARRFLDAVAGLDLLERQQLYVDAFDFDRRASLHLTAHTHGDRRQRGARLVGIKHTLRAAGLEPTDRELPDHLAVLLELRALAPSVGAELLRELRPALEIVRSRLHAKESPYAHVVDAVSATLPRLTRAERAAAERLATEGPPGEQVGLEPFAPAEVMPVAGAAR